VSWPETLKPGSILRITHERSNHHAWGSGRTGSYKVAKGDLITLVKKVDNWTEDHYRVPSPGWLYLHNGALVSISYSWLQDCTEVVYRAEE
jgi:hypothetical protein